MWDYTNRDYYKSKLDFLMIIVKIFELLTLGGETVNALVL